MFCLLFFFVAHQMVAFNITQESMEDLQHSIGVQLRLFSIYEIKIIEYVYDKKMVDGYFRNTNHMCRLDGI